MAFLSDNDIDKILAHVTNDPVVLKRKYKSKKNEYDEISIEYNELDGYLNDGWEEINRLKKKIKLQRRKDIGRMFEDKMWCMFYDLGFTTLNTDEKLTIKWGNNTGDHQQIDILAVGDDAIFVVECKATASPKSTSFKSTIDNIEHTREGVVKSLQQIYGKDKKIKFVFATHNYRFTDSSEDLRRLKEKKIFHFNENAFNYVANLIKAYKGSVIYQFYGLMLKNETINNDKIRIPALRGSMGNRTYYMLSIEPSILLKLGFVLHRTKVNDSMAPTYQRLLVPSRLKGITKFIDAGGYFPNSIIVNFDTAGSKKKIQFEAAGKVSGDSDSRFGTLVIPNTYGIAYIIDGQHRVYGYAASKYKDTNTIPVVAFVDMESREQLQIFMDINENQKAVSPSLKLDLKEDIDWASSRVDSRIGALRSAIIKTLTRDYNSVLFTKISVGEDSSSLALRPFDEALKKSSLLPKCNQKAYIEDTDVCLYDCNSLDFDKAMEQAKKRISRLIRDCYAYVKEHLREELYYRYIESNRGTFGFIALIGSLNKHLIQTGILSQKSTTEHQMMVLEPYLSTFVVYLSTLSDEDANELNMALGQGADTKWLRKFQASINKVFPQYVPDGLENWLETQDKDLQEEGHKLGREIIEYLYHRVIEKVQELYGDRWESAISDVRARCKNRINDKEAIDENFNAEEADWVDYIEFSDVKSIVEKNWSVKSENDSDFITFEKEFSINIGEPFKLKKDKLRWITDLNSFRDSWEKPKGKLLTRSQVDTLHIILSSLKPE
ncbi:MAG: DGQHR domain-containing protein [Muribaculaceae bacterium]|nr:DGQHR domain-containing protein [Muribaculaceae bacterium]